MRCQLNCKICGPLFALIILGFLAVGCNMPTAQPASTVTASGEVPTQARPTQTVATRLPTEPAVDQVTIYLVALEDNGKGGIGIGCGDSLVPVQRTIAPTNQAVNAALMELFSVKQQFLGQSGLYNALYQSNLQVEDVRIDENGIAEVSISGSYQLGGVCDTPRFKGQIQETIKAVRGVQSANVLLNGKTLDQALSLK